MAVKFASEPPYTHPATADGRVHHLNQPAMFSPRHNKMGEPSGKAEDHEPSRKGGRKGAAAQSHATRVKAGKKAAATRKRNAAK